MVKYLYLERPMIRYWVDAMQEVETYPLMEACCRIGQREEYLYKTVCFVAAYPRVVRRWL